MAGIFDLIDDALLEIFKITIEELDYICEYASDEELQTFVDALGKFGESPTFREIREGLKVRNKYQQLYNESKIQTDS